MKKTGKIVAGTALAVALTTGSFEAGAQTERARLTRAGVVTRLLNLTKACEKEGLQGEARAVWEAAQKIFRMDTAK